MNKNWILELAKKAYHDDKIINPSKMGFNVVETMLSDGSLVYGVTYENLTIPAIDKDCAYRLQEALEKYTV